MKGARLKLGLAFVVAGVAAFLAFRIHFFFLEPKGVLVGYDERYLAPFGLRMIDGASLPYVDAVSHRGPLLYWMVELFQRVIGPFEWAALRWLSLVFTGLTIAACFAVGVVTRRPMAGAIGALVFAYLVTCVLEVGAGIGANGELVASPFAVAALAFVGWGLERSSPRWSPLWLALGGASAACAGLAKQTSVVTIVPLFVWVGLSAWGNRRSVLRGLASLVGGWLLPLLATVGVYAARGHLSTFWYWFASYNARIYMEPYPRGEDLRIVVEHLNQHPLVVLGILVPIAIAGVLPLASSASLSPRELARTCNLHGLEVAVAWATALTLIAACLPLRFWPHYFVSAFPFVGLLAGLLVEGFVGRGSTPSRLMAHALVASVLCAWFAYGHTQRLAALDMQRKLGHYRGRGSNEICDAVQAHSKPGDRVFIWGFDGDFYIDCKRKPASRFVFTTFVAGVVPPFWKEAKPSRIAPGAPELLEADLRATKPPLILDFYETVARKSVHDVPQLTRLLDEEYCPRDEVQARGRKARVWVRREGGRCAE